MAELSVDEIRQLARGFLTGQADPSGMEAMQKVLEEDPQLGLELLTLQSFQAQILYCRDEFTGLKDLAGRKVRSSGASQADFIERSLQQVLETGKVMSSTTKSGVSDWASLSAEAPSPAVTTSYPSF